MGRSKSEVAVLVMMAVCSVTPGLAAASDTQEAQSLNEVRNTVVNLLQALVEKGVMSRDQAETLVKQAQEKAQAQAAQAAQSEQAEANAVRVPYVPEIVKQEIRDQVAKDLKPQVVSDVLAAAHNEKWGVPGALPEWIGRVKVIGDVRVREQDDVFATDNAPNTYLNFLQVNASGGIGRAGVAGLLNTTEDRLRMRARARLGVEVQISDEVKAGIRASTGNLVDPVSTNQTLGNSGARYQFGVEQAYIRWDHSGSRPYPWLTVLGGRTPNPWVSTDLLWDNDLSFEGVALTYRQGLSSADPAHRQVFLTIGGFPLQEVELSRRDKWLLGAQLGTDWTFANGMRLKIAGAIYDYENIVGKQNAPDSNLLDFTAPQFLQKGNTLYDIRNDTDASTNLFALAADYTDVDVLATIDVPLSSDLRLGFTADYVKNISFSKADVFARTGLNVRPRTTGYQAEFNIGHANALQARAWRAFLGYRYLEADAVLDAFTDSDFHGGGTDAKGYFLGGDFGVARNTWLRLRYLTADAIDGAPLGIDLWQLDVNAQF
jgi:polyhydroxyalkanoate synthesis regulator phasin